MDELLRIVEALEADPIFAMSLGSKELFHSNLLAWFLERSQSLRHSIADAWDVPPGPQTSDGRLWLEREWRDLDVVMHIPGRQVLVVENKVLALPDEDQLDQYAATAIGTLPGSPSMVLLSLTDPGWPGNTWTSPCGKVWTYRSYAELVSVMRVLAPTVAPDDEFVAELFERWAALLAKLVDLTAAVGSPGDHEPLRLDQVSRLQLARVRLDGPVQKMRCQSVSRQVRRAVAADDSTEPIRFYAGLTRGAGLVEAFTYGDYPRFGWQLQGDQFRLAMIVGPDEPGYGRNPAAREARFAEADRYSAYFDFDHVRRHATANEAQEHGYRRYDPDFVYRYIRIPDITVRQAVSAGVGCAQWARRFREDLPTADSA